ncbi:hypothetical protein B0T21DRAFT_350923 [Apiosordaria backusii]|uniref:Uncharacterized protein n=1 Tax=Apiosordaria backusii TaxID=314023 RepID=A0AA40AXH0_9PEZI|nr:hypothetical protein B0T21DRAFT_350923 [Apiosordaria backusii]
MHNLRAIHDGITAIHRMKQMIKNLHDDYTTKSTPLSQLSMRSLEGPPGHQPTALKPSWISALPTLMRSRATGRLPHSQDHPRRRHQVAFRWPEEASKALFHGYIDLKGYAKRFERIEVAQRLVRVLQGEVAGAKRRQQEKKTLTSEAYRAFEELLKKEPSLIQVRTADNMILPKQEDLEHMIAQATRRKVRGMKEVWHNRVKWARAASMRFAMIRVFHINKNIGGNKANMAEKRGRRIILALSVTFQPNITELTSMGTPNPPARTFITPSDPHQECRMAKLLNTRLSAPTRAPDLGYKREARGYFSEGTSSKQPATGGGSSKNSKVTVHGPLDSTTSTITPCQTTSL